MMPENSLLRGLLLRGDEEVDRAPLLEPTLRTRGGASGVGMIAQYSGPPAFANQHIVVRNDREIIRRLLRRKTIVVCCERHRLCLELEI
ncbi:MAG: hypothetical protein Ct9H300mP25_14110 [Acidobacteriota bacterium]|nr:MAG: hypothetical protein Ct9H300mP25_14110 [Acidobacteriota bacterium]